MVVSWEVIGGLVSFLTLAGFLGRVVWKSAKIDEQLITLNHKHSKALDELKATENRIDIKISRIEDTLKIYDDIVMSVSKDVGYIRGALETILNYKKTGE